MIGQFQWVYPSTWPWVIYVWAAFAIVGMVKPAWKWLRRKQAEDWSIADGRIDHTDVSKPGFSFTIRQGYYLAELGYAYAVGGTHYSGSHKREFPTEIEANEFVRDLQGKTVLIRYNPHRNSSSMLRLSDVEIVQRTRVPSSAVGGPPSGNAVPEWLNQFLWLFVAISCVGLTLSLWVHVGAIMGQRVAPPSFFWMLHMGIFVVWVPAVLIARRLVGNTNRKDFWRVILKDSPGWLRYFVYGFIAYAVVNFLFFIAKAPARDVGTDTPAEVWRGFSGHWMAFYSAAFAILYSTVRAPRLPSSSQPD